LPLLDEAHENRALGHWALGRSIELWALGRSTRAQGTWAIHWHSWRSTGALDTWAIKPARERVVRRSHGALIGHASGAGLATNYRPRDPLERWAVDPQSIRNPLSAGQWPQFTGALLPRRHHWTPPSSSNISAFWLVRSLGMSTLSGSHVRSYIVWFPEALPAGVNSILLLSVSVSFGRWEVSRTEYFFLENWMETANREELL
jgi:hypothetical protein